MFPGASLPGDGDPTIVFRDNSATLSHGVVDDAVAAQKAINAPTFPVYAGPPDLLAYTTRVAHEFSPGGLAYPADVAPGSSPTNKVEDVGVSRVSEYVDAQTRLASEGANNAGAAGLLTQNGHVTLLPQDASMADSVRAFSLHLGGSSDALARQGETAYPMREAMATTPTATPTFSSRDGDTALLSMFIRPTRSATPAPTTIVPPAENADMMTLPSCGAKQDEIAENAIAFPVQEWFTSKLAENGTDSGANLIHAIPSMMTKIDTVEDAADEEDAEGFLDFAIKDLPLAANCDANFEELAFETIAVPMKKRICTDRVGDDLPPAEPLVPLPIPEPADGDHGGDGEGRELSEDDVGLLSDGDEDIRAEMRCYGEECFKPLLRSVNSMEVKNSSVLGMTDMYRGFNEAKINSAAAPVKKKSAGDADTMFKTLQWVRHHAETNDGVPLTPECVKKIALQIIWAGSGRDAMTCINKWQGRFLHKWKKEKVEPWAGMDIGSYVYRYRGQKRKTADRREESRVGVCQWPTGEEDAASDSCSAHSDDFLIRHKNDKCAGEDGVKPGDDNGEPGGCSGDITGDSGKPDGGNDKPAGGSGDPIGDSGRFSGGIGEPGGGPNGDSGKLSGENDESGGGSGDPSGNGGQPGGGNDEPDGGPSGDIAKLGGDTGKPGDGGDKRESVDANGLSDDPMDGTFQGTKKRRKEEEEVPKVVPPVVSSDEDSVFVMCPEGWMQAKKLRKRKKKKRPRPAYPPSYPPAQYPPYPLPPYGYHAAPPYGFPGPHGAPHPYGYPPMVGGPPPGDHAMMGYPGGAPMVHPEGMRPPMMPAAPWPYPPEPRKKRRSKKARRACSLEENTCVSDSD
eukprot:GEMP01004866.1.p1 GENE.GEMP01004866.1~~GEMP01004866.1.p1  ORF type:complete len:852 (+),score=212.44 GEMP01004866.1:281-2836(+)